jgi:hypothetical protein
MAFLTCVSFCKRALQNRLRAAAGSYYSKHPYSAKLFGHTRGEPVEDLGGPELGPFLYAPNAAARDKS